MDKIEKKRILALDIMRGITIAGMIMVNNAGNGNYVYAPLCHARWIGLTPTDFAFPFFMFMMGMTTFLSLKRYDYKPSIATYRKILVRTLGLILCFIIIEWFYFLCNYCHLGEDGTGLNVFEKIASSVNIFGVIRYSGVLVRLAICYCIVAVLATLVKHRFFPWIILALFATYFVILKSGDGFTQGQSNILSIVDVQVLTLQHMYNDNYIDPEGILSTIPSIAHVMIGFCVGCMIFNKKRDESSSLSREALLYSKVTRLLLLGAGLVIAGYLLSYGCPISKKIWSPTFSLITCGSGAMILAILIWIIDIKNKKKWGTFFKAFGVNPLFMYVMSELCMTLMGRIHLMWNGESVSLRSFVCDTILNPIFGNYGSSCMYAILYVGLIWCIGYPLYKNKIYLKF